MPRKKTLVPKTSGRLNFFLLIGLAFSKAIRMRFWRGVNPACSVASWTTWSEFEVMIETSVVKHFGATAMPLMPRSLHTVWKAGCACFLWFRHSLHLKATERDSDERLPRLSFLIAIVLTR